jgi:nitrate reductase gamma subunit
VNTFRFIVGAILPYVVVPAFVAGMSYRFWTWFKSPQPAKMTLFPAGGSTFREVLVETLLFPSLFRGDRVLWFLAWFFHATLVLVFLGHIRVFTGFIDRMLQAFGMTPKGLDLMSGVVGGAAGILLLVIGLLLLLRRVALPRVREITGIPDILAILLVLVIIVTGDLLRFSASFDLEQTRVWAASLLAFSPVIPTNEMFFFHLALSQVLILFIPFSKILHLGGFFFTQTLIKRR